MEFSDLTRLQTLHDRARRGELSGTELDLYSSVMRGYIGGLVAHHNRSLSERQTARRHLRIARSVQVEVDAVTALHRTLTLDCGVGGFSAVLPSPEAQDAVFTARLKLGAQELVTARVRIADQRRVRGSARVSFAIVEIGEEERERLEMFVRDAALSRSYWVLAPCAVPILVPVAPPHPTARPPSGGRDSDESSFVLVVTRAPAVMRAEGPRPARVAPARLVASSRDPAALRRSWW